MSRGRPEPVRGTTPEECSPNHLSSSPLPPHILESPDKWRAHTNNLCFSVKQHAFSVFFQYPQLCSQCRALNLSEDNSADRGSITRQPLPSVKYMPLSSPSFLLPSAERRSTGSFMLNILAMYTSFALFFSDWQFKFPMLDQHSHLRNSLFAHKTIYWEYNTVLSEQNDSWR